MQDQISGRCAGGEFKVTLADVRQGVQVIFVSKEFALSDEGHKFFVQVLEDIYPFKEVSWSTTPNADCTVAALTHNETATLDDLKVGARNLAEVFTREISSLGKRRMQQLFRKVEQATLV